jgi:tRNA 2-selenouridine synthase
MSTQLPVEEFLVQASHKPVIDVRSPGEFAQGHIPGAVNIPLFTDEERAKVGTRYKQVNKESAVLLGLDIVGPKMSDFVKKAKKIAPHGQVLVHCWRGGMRSGSFGWLLQTTGFSVATLQKGYKAYRTQVLQSFEKSYQLMVLGGKTGSGKTALLREIARQGEQVLDLEAIAHHKGSAFGSIGESAQPTVEQFENDLHAALTALDPARRIWVEDESFTIGSVRIPIAFFKQLRQAPVIFIDVPKEERIERLVADYTGFDSHLLQLSLDKINKRLGGQHFAKACTALQEQDYAQVADITLVYYDKAYLYGISQREAQSVFKLSLSGGDVEEKAKDIIHAADAHPLLQPLKQHNTILD